MPDDRCLAPRVPNRASVYQGALVEIGARVEVVGPRRQPPQQPQDICRTSVIVGGLKERDQRLELTPGRVVGLAGAGLDAHECEPDLGSGFQPPIAGAARSPDHRFEQRLGFGQAPALKQCVSEVNLEFDPPDVVWFEQRGRSLEEIDRGVHVPAIERPLARRAQPCGGSAGEGPIRRTEIGAVAVGLLEVKAKDLVELLRVPTQLCLQPGCIPFVQFGAQSLGDRLVGRVADQHMPKAETVVAEKDRRIRPDELLTHQRDQV